MATVFSASGYSITDFGVLFNAQFTVPTGSTGFYWMTQTGPTGNPDITLTGAILAAGNTSPQIYGIYIILTPIPSQSL